MNIHYLELFYHVARHGGVAAATRNMPYGIQMSAISGQMSALEESLGTRLFERRPFALTPAGEELYQFVQPFFENVEAVENKIRAGSGRQLRIGASELVLRDYLPPVFATVRKQFPGLKLVLRSGHQAFLEELLRRREIDLALTILEKTEHLSLAARNGETPLPESVRGRLVPSFRRRDVASPVPASRREGVGNGLCAQTLFQLPLALVVPKNSKLKQAEALWENGPWNETLLCLPESHAITRQFQDGLKRLGVDWLPAVEVGSTELIEAYVRNGYGIGVSVEFPRTKPPAGLRILPLKTFTPVTFGILWKESPDPQMTAFIDVVKASTEKMEKLSK
jgi:DNA-binding transcriptional LysR family regulator